MNPVIRSVAPLIGREVRHTGIFPEGIPWLAPLAGLGKQFELKHLLGTLPVCRAHAI